MSAQQVAQMAAEGKLKPSQDEQIDQILKDILAECGIVPSDARNVLKIKSYIELKRRQATKAKNQRKTLRDLHKAYRAIMMENRWLKSAIKETIGGMGWANIVSAARKTLWREFKEVFKYSSTKD